MNIPIFSGHDSFSIHGFENNIKIMKIFEKNVISSIPYLKFIANETLPKIGKCHLTRISLVPKREKIFVKKINLKLNQKNQNNPKIVILKPCFFKQKLTKNGR